MTQDYLKYTKLSIMLHNSCLLITEIPDFCIPLSDDPVNGNIHQPKHDIDAVAIYTCDFGYQLTVNNANVSDFTRTCVANITGHGIWNNAANVTCEGE